MTKGLGRLLPEDLYRRLSDPDITAKGSRVIMFATVDENGWPHLGMLSHYEVTARERGKILMLTYRASRSTRNIKRSGVVTLLFVDEEMNYYVKTRCKEVKGIPEAPDETLFEAEVIEVLEDKYPTAKITSGITFEGYDPGMTREGRTKVFHRLLGMTTSKDEGTKI